MKAKKIILAGALLTSVLLTACGTKVEESESETTGKTEPAENVATEESDTQQVTASAQCRSQASGTVCRSYECPF